MRGRDLVGREGGERSYWCAPNDPEMEAGGRGLPYGLRSRFHAGWYLRSRSTARSSSSASRRRSMLSSRSASLTFLDTGFSATHSMNAS